MFLSDIILLSFFSDSELEMKLYRIKKLLKYLKRLRKKKRSLNQRSHECEFCSIVGRLRCVADSRTVIFNILFP